MVLRRKRWPSFFLNLEKLWRRWSSWNFAFLLYGGPSSPVVHACSSPPSGNETLSPRFRRRTRVERGGRQVDESKGVPLCGFLHGRNPWTTPDTSKNVDRLMIRHDENDGVFELENRSIEFIFTFLIKKINKIFNHEFCMEIILEYL